MSEAMIPLSQKINAFMYTISTDQFGKIGSKYTEHEETIEHFLNITPEEFNTLYNQYKNQTNYVSSNPEYESKTHFKWLPEGTHGIRCIKEIYNELKQNNKIYDKNTDSYTDDNRPLTFRFALLMWLYIWH